MKLKHWQGYGAITAQKISMTSNNGVTNLHILVTGDHEYGIECKDEYTVGKWLVTRFDKSFDDYRKIIDIRTETGYNDNGVETCDYYIKYQQT